MNKSDLNRKNKEIEYIKVANICFWSGICQLTLMPIIMGWCLLFPESFYFQLPGCMLLFIALVVWQFFPDYNSLSFLSVGIGLIFFGSIQLLTTKNLAFYYDIVAYTAILIGLLFVLAELKSIIKLRYLREFSFISSLVSSVVLIFVIIIGWFIGV